MTIDHIHIKGFKTLENVSFEPGRVNVFVGANGSGKTTILEAIGVLSAAMTDRVDNNAMNRKGIRLSVPQLYKSGFKDLPKRPSSIQFSMAWHQEQDQYAYAVHLNAPSNAEPSRGEAWKYQQESLQKNAQFVWERKTSPSFEEDPYVGRLMVDAKLNGAKACIESIRDYAVFQPNTPSLRGTQADPYQTVPIGLCGGRLAEAIEDILTMDENGDVFIGSVIMDDLLELIDWADGFTVTTPKKSSINASVPTSRRILEFQDRYLKQDVRFTAYDASEGALYVLFLMVLATHRNAPQIFAIDGFDHAMHPRLARAATRLFCATALQHKKIAFITTHNPLVLDGLDLQNDDVRLFAVDKSKKTGHTTIHRIQISPELLDSGLSLSRLWLEGRLGGAPDLL